MYLNFERIFNNNVRITIWENKFNVTWGNLGESEKLRFENKIERSKIEWGREEVLIEKINGNSEFF